MIPPSTVAGSGIRVPKGFPRPLGKVGQAVVWRWTEIEAWAAEHRPTPQQSRHASEPQE